MRKKLEILANLAVAASSAGLMCYLSTVFMYKIPGIAGAIAYCSFLAALWGLAVGLFGCYEARSVSNWLAIPYVLSAGFLIVKEESYWLDWIEEVITVGVLVALFSFFFRGSYTFARGLASKKREVSIKRTPFQQWFFLVIIVMIFFSFIRVCFGWDNINFDFVGNETRIAIMTLAVVMIGALLGWLGKKFIESQNSSVEEYLLIVSYCIFAGAVILGYLGTDFAYEGRADWLLVFRAENIEYWGTFLQIATTAFAGGTFAIKDLLTKKVEKEP